MHDTQCVFFVSLSVDLCIENGLAYFQQNFWENAGRLWCLWTCADIFFAEARTSSIGTGSGGLQRHRFVGGLVAIFHLAHGRSSGGIAAEGLLMEASTTSGGCLSKPDVARNAVFVRILSVT